LTIEGEELRPFGPVYDAGTNVLLSPQNLGTIYSNTFNVTTPASVLTPFQIPITYADVPLALSSGPASDIDATFDNPNPPVDYTITVTNNGPAIAMGVVLSDFLPSQLSFSNSAPTTVGVSFANGVATFPIQTLIVGGSMTVTIAADFSGEGGTVTSLFTLAADESDPDLQNNYLSESTFVNAGSASGARRVRDHRGRTSERHRRGGR
jgi:uncharacterized repeat protein (TIGR01451 family)